MDMQTPTSNTQRRGLLSLALLLVLLAVVTARGETCPVSGTCDAGNDQIDHTLDAPFFASLASFYSFGSGAVRSHLADLTTPETTFSLDVAPHVPTYAGTTLPILSVAPKTSPPSHRC